jgi:hypothetical protein
MTPPPEDPKDMNEEEKRRWSHEGVRREIKQNLQLIQEERQAIQNKIQESNRVVTSYHDNVERINKKAKK